MSIKNAILPILGFALLIPGCMIDGDLARENAATFARSTLGMKNPKVNCQNTDSDGDGYVSCTVVDKGTSDREAIECSGWGSWNDGCRLATGKSRRR